MDATETETKAAVPAEDDEAAEILSAMLGLAPPASKKRRKSSAKVSEGQVVMACRSSQGRWGVRKASEQRSSLAWVAVKRRLMKLVSPASRC